MANAITHIILLIIFCGSAYGKRSKLLEGQAVVAALAPSSSYGICKTLVETQGYACEEHTVTTQDGFILGIQRILGPSSGGTPGNKTPVLLQHGILMDAAAWLLLSPGQSLAFLLADSGFDVWLANARGTQSGSGHTSLSPEDPAFWNWSWMNWLFLIFLLRFNMFTIKQDSSCTMLAIHWEL